MSDKSAGLESQPARSPGLLGAIFLILFATPFAGFGMFALVAGVRKLVSGNLHDGPLLCLFGIVFAGVGFGLMFLAVWSRKKTRETAVRQARFAGQPWMIRPDWAAGKIASTAAAPPIFLWIWAVAALLLSSPAVWNLPRELHKHNYAILMVLLFPIVAFALIGYCIVQWRQRRRFAPCCFELAQIPIPLGGTVDGMIRLGGRLKLERGLNLKLACIRRVVTGAGKDRNTQEQVLWQQEKVYQNEMPLPEPEPGHTGIPIFFQLPQGQPQCFSLNDVSVIWRLEARAKLSGPDFRARFDLPVFKVDGVVPDNDAVAVPADSGADSTAAWEAPMAEIRQDEHSRIQISDGPAGREFYFPAARNLGTALMLTLFLLVWSGFLWLMLDKHAPLLFPIVFGLAEVFLLYGVFVIWFKSSRVTISPVEVCVTKRYLIFGRTRRFPATDVARFGTKMGMQSGSQVFTDIRLILNGADAEFAARARAQPSPPNVNQLVLERMREAAGPRGITVASSIANSMEAEWLVREMNRALGRKV